MLARRMQSIPLSGTARARAAAQDARDARKVIDLAAGEIVRQPPMCVLEAAAAAVRSGSWRYTDTLGLPDLRTAIAVDLKRTTGADWSANDIAVTAGGKQALYHALMALVNPGEEVIIPQPYWASFPAQVRLAGATPVFLDTSLNGYVPTAFQIECAITRATRAILLNTPNNPTGAVYGPDLLRAVADLATKYGLWIILDACYDAFLFHQSAERYLAEFLRDADGRAVVVNTFSKRLAIAGWRLGYLAGPREVIAAVRALQSHMTSNPSSIAQHAVLAYLQKGDADYDRACLSALIAARQRGQAILDGLPWLRRGPAHGGFYFYLDVSPILTSGSPKSALNDADDVAALLLESASVATVTGTAFGDSSGLRLSYGIDLPLLEEGLVRVVEALSPLSPKELLAAQ